MIVYRLVPMNIKILILRTNLTIDIVFSIISFVVLLHHVFLSVYFTVEKNILFSHR